SWSIQAFCTLCKVPFCASPSIVVICLPTASLTTTPHERVATPSICTVQAPHWAMPQPYLVPVRPTFSRIAHSSGVLGSTSTSCAVPLMVRRAIPKLLDGLDALVRVSAIARSPRQSPAPTHDPSLAPFGRRFEYPEAQDPAPSDHNCGKAEYRLHVRSTITSAFCAKPALTVSLLCFPSGGPQRPDPAERVMAVGVMHVGHVRVRMPKRAMLVKVRMRLAGRIGGVMRMPVMRIVHVGMRVREDFVN